MGGDDAIFWRITKQKIELQKGLMVNMQAGKYKGMQGVIKKWLPNSGRWGLKMENGARVKCSGTSFDAMETRKKKKFKLFQDYNTQGSKIEFMIKSKWREVDSHDWEPCEACGGTGFAKCGEEHCTKVTSSDLYQSHYVHGCTRPCRCEKSQGYFRVENLMMTSPTESENNASPTKSEEKESNGAGGELGGLAIDIFGGIINVLAKMS